ncbi:hypothetical protein D3C76_789010 [compost metagenome]
MDHGINTGRGSDMRWQPQRQFGIQHRQVWQQGWRDHHILFTGTGGDHRDSGNLRASTGGGGHQDQRQACALALVDAIDLRQLLAAAQQQRSQLGGIQRTAATKSDHAIGAASPARFNRSENHCLWRVGQYLGKYLHRHARCSKTTQHRFEQPGCHDARVGHQQHRAGPQVQHLRGKTGSGTALDDDRAGGIECHR